MAAAPWRKKTGELSTQDDGQEVWVGGWVQEVRNLGGICFLQLRDRDGVVQVTVLKKKSPELFTMLTGLSRETVVLIRGTLKVNAEAKRGFEILPSEVQVQAPAEAPLPLGIVDKVRAEMDTRLDNRILDVRKPEIAAVFQLRAVFLQGVRRYLEQQGFVEVATPKVVGAGAEGGATLFKTDYFGKPAYLAQSPQLYKQMLMGAGLDRVYEIAPAFRAELSDTTRHVAEFTSYDAEVSFIRDQEDFLSLLEGSLIAGMTHTLEQGKALLETIAVQPKVPTLPLTRLSYPQALERIAEGGREIPDGQDIDTEAEKILGRVMAEKGVEMYFIKGYPAAIKPFYVMVQEDDPDYTHSFDLDYKGDEMASGGQREHRVERLTARMQTMGLNVGSFDFYLKAFRYGMPPHGGWGLGVDRFIQKMLDLPNIREAILFPRDRSRLVP